MKIILNADQLTKLDATLQRYQHMLPPSVAANALRKSARPMFRAAKDLVPVSNDGREYVRLRREGWSVHADANVGRRGGATRRDLRIKAVKGEHGEVGRVLVGVSQKNGKVGWRTHFITTGFTDKNGRKHTGNNFLKQAYDQTIGEVKLIFSQELYIEFQKWGKKNLPQGRV